MLTISSSLYTRSQGWSLLWSSLLICLFLALVQLYQQHHTPSLDRSRKDDHCRSSFQARRLPRDLSRPSRSSAGTSSSSQLKGHRNCERHHLTVDSWHGPSPSGDWGRSSWRFFVSLKCDHSPLRYLSSSRASSHWSRTPPLSHSRQSPSSSAPPHEENDAARLQHEENHEADLWKVITGISETCHLYLLNFRTLLFKVCSVWGTFLEQPSLFHWCCCQLGRS